MLGKPKLRTQNHDSGSFAASQYRELEALLETNEWMRMKHCERGSGEQANGRGGEEDAGVQSVNIWMKGCVAPTPTAQSPYPPGHPHNPRRRRGRSVASPEGLENMAEFRVWRWGSSWFWWTLGSFRNNHAQALFLGFIEEQYTQYRREQLLKPPTVKLGECPMAIDNRNMALDQKIQGMTTSIPIGGITSFVWPLEDEKGSLRALIGLFEDAMRFQSTASGIHECSLPVCSRCCFWFACAVASGLLAGRACKQLKRMLSFGAHIRGLCRPTKSGTRKSAFPFGAGTFCTARLKAARRTSSSYSPATLVWTSTSSTCETQP